MAAPPDAFVCPLTLEIMEDPVVTPEGLTFSRAAIEHWLATNAVNPITRTPLAVADLAPNYSLRDAIAAWLAQNGGSVAPPAAQAKPAAAAAVPQGAASISVSLTGTSAEGTPGVAHIMATLTPPEGAERVPVDVCCVIDVSGSMDTEATIKNAAGETESHGLSVLDVVKHAVRTIIEAMAPADRLSLVAYSSTAQTVLELTAMSAAGKQAALAQLAKLQPDGSTNLWDGLHHGLENLRKNSTPSRLSSVLLLTDGQPNVIPPRGHIPMLQRYKDKHQELQCTINTFGFGYNLDSALLRDLALEGDGSYSFIPDSGMVGTIFVHTLANLLSTAARNAQLTLQADDDDATPAAVLQPVLGAHRVTATSYGQVVTLGSIAYGQPRHVVVPVQLPAGRSAAGLRAVLRYTPIGSSTPVEAEATLSDAEATVAPGAIDAQVARLRTTAVIDEAVRLCQQHDEAGARAAVLALRQELRRSRSVNESSTLTLLEDLDGQITEAVSKPEFFRRWGRHYLPSLQRAHLLEACNNFKDPGVQRYGGRLFQTVRDAIDDLFCALPPPKPSKKLTGNRAPVRSMAAYSNRYNPCFHGNCLVRLADGSPRRVADLRRGDLVHTAAGAAPARVLCVVKTHCTNQRTSLVQFPGGLRLTPYHPVRVDGQWQFPLALHPAAEQPCDAVYSFVLDHGHVMTINGVEVCTLGHGFTDNAVIAHPYLGTDRVVQDLRAMPGWAAGHIEFRPGCMARDRSSTLMAGFNRSHLVAT